MMASNTEVCNLFAMIDFKHDQSHNGRVQQANTRPAAGNSRAHTQVYSAR
jgi:hypothetical protein